MYIDYSIPSTPPSTETFVNPSDILFFLASVATLLAPLNPCAGVGALCLLLFFFNSSFPVPAVVVVAVETLTGPGIGPPPFVMYARPSRWRLSVLSNLAGRNMSGSFFEFGRWNACLSALCTNPHGKTYDTLLMKTLDHVTEPLDIRVITQHHSHCRRDISFPCQMRDRGHVGSKVGASLRNRWRWISDFISPTRCLPVYQHHPRIE